MAVKRKVIHSQYKLLILMVVVLEEMPRTCCVMVHLSMNRSCEESQASISEVPGADFINQGVSPRRDAVYPPFSFLKH